MSAKITNLEQFKKVKNDINELKNKRDEENKKLKETLENMSKEQLARFLRLFQ